MAVVYLWLGGRCLTIAHHSVPINYILKIILRRDHEDVLSMIDYITLFGFITMFCGTDNIKRNILSYSPHTVYDVQE